MLAILALTAFEAFGQDTRELDRFTGVGIGVGADVRYSTGNSHKIVSEGNSRDVEDLITEVKNGVLKVRYEDWRTNRSKLTIHITSPELDHISISGSAKFQSEQALTAEEFSMSISGSGTVMLPGLTCEELDVKISGSGDGYIEKGSAEELDVKISGSGKLYAEHFEAGEFSAALSGSGGIRITVRDELEARISGSGSIYYHGTPRVNSTTSGSGKVRAL